MFKGLKLSDMNKRTYMYKTPYVEEEHTDYEYTFGNGVRVSISQMCNGGYDLSVYESRDGRSGSALCKTPEEGLEYFNNMWKNNELRAELVPVW